MSSGTTREHEGVPGEGSFELAARTALRLIKAIEEHGAPNSFSFSELVGRRDAMLAGKAVRKHWAEFCTSVRTRTNGVRVNLSGRLYVEPPL